MSVLRQIGGLGAANVVYLLSQLGILSLLSKLSDIETVAAFGFIMAVLQPLYTLSLMGLRNNLATDARREFSYETFLTIRVFMSGVLFVTALAIIAWVQPSYIALAIPVALMKAVEMHSDLCYGALQRAGRIKPVAHSMFIRGPAALTLFGVVLYSTKDPHIAFWSQTVVWLSVQLLLDYPNVRSAGETVRFDFEIKRILALSKNTAFLGLGNFFSSLQENVPRFFVSSQLGTTALALLTAMSAIQRASLVLFNTIEQAIGWRLSQLWVSGNRRKYFYMIGRMLLVAASIAIVGIILAKLFGHYFIELVFGNKYLAAQDLLFWVSCSIGVRMMTSVLQTSVSAQRRFRTFGTVQIFMLFVTFPASWYGIQHYGLEGVGMAILFTNVLRALIFVAILLQSLVRNSVK